MKFEDLKNLSDEELQIELKYVLSDRRLILKNLSENDDKLIDIKQELNKRHENRKEKINRFIISEVE